MARASNLQRATDPVEKLVLILEKCELDHEAAKSRAIGPDILVENDSLRDWLAIATKGLCHQAQVRIVSEIADHFADSMATEQQKGRTLEAAERAAMTALGSPKSARRKLRKANLTQRESRILSGITGDLHSALGYLVSMPVAVLLVFLITLLSNYLNTQPVDFTWADLGGMGLIAGYFLPFWLGPILLALDKRHSLQFAVRSIACAQGIILFSLLTQICIRFALMPPLPVDVFSHNYTNPAFVIAPLVILAVFWALIVSGYAFFAVSPAIRLAQKLSRAQGPVQS